MISRLPMANARRGGAGPLLRVEPCGTEVAGAGGAASMVGRAAASRLAGCMDPVPGIPKKPASVRAISPPATHLALRSKRPRAVGPLGGQEVERL